MSSSSRKKINISLMIPFLVMALFFAVTIWQKYRASRELPVSSELQRPAGKWTAVLFFVADSTYLAREARELDPCDGVTACLKDLLDELVNGPVGEFDEALPDGTVINTVRVEADQAEIDLGTTFAEALPSGSSAEMLAVYSIVDTVTVNFPQIKKVKLNIDGNVKSLLRHLDLSEPLAPDYTLELQPQQPHAQSVAPRPPGTTEGGVK